MQEKKKFYLTEIWEYAETAPRLEWSSFVIARLSTDYFVPRNDKKRERKAEIWRPKKN